jgi:ubiquinone/menaquinone biosynthesis C-methylase UbiE
MKFTGERAVPNESCPKGLFKEHLDRYLFAKKFVKNKIVLDIACGAGYGSFELKKAGAKKVFGGDISKEAVDFANQNYKLKDLSFQVMDCVKIPIKDNSIDVLVSFETIEHIPNYLGFLKEVKRVLKKGGLFICSSPNKQITSPFSKLSEFHVKEFYIKELMQVLDKFGFKKQGIYGQNKTKNNFKFYLKSFIGSYLSFIVKIFRKIKKKKETMGNTEIFKMPIEKGYAPQYFLVIYEKI